MTAMVKQNPFGAWTWEVVDDDGETYLRSDHCFAESGLALSDLQAATCLIQPYVQFR